MTHLAAMRGADSRSPGWGGGPAGPRASPHFPPFKQISIMRPSSGTMDRVPRAGVPQGSHDSLSPEGASGEGGCCFFPRCSGAGGVPRSRSLSVSRREAARHARGTASACTGRSLNDRVTGGVADPGLPHARDVTVCSQRCLRVCAHPEYSRAPGGEGPWPGWGWTEEATFRSGAVGPSRPCGCRDRPVCFQKPLESMSAGRQGGVREPRQLQSLERQGLL